MNQNHKVNFAEITESSLYTFSGCCWQWNQAPEFGSIVKVRQQEKTILAMVYDVKTVTLDPMHEVHVYKKTESEIQKEYPHLFDFLKTTFHALIMGYFDENQQYYHYPKNPLKLYSFVSYPESNELQSFFSDIKSITLILQPRISLENHQELLCAIIETQKKLGLLSQERLTAMMTQYAFATNASYRQLKQFLDRVS